MNELLLNPMNYPTENLLRLNKSSRKEPMYPNPKLPPFSVNPLQALLSNDEYTKFLGWTQLAGVGNVPNEWRRTHYAKRYLGKQHHKKK